MVLRFACVGGEFPTSHPNTALSSLSISGISMDQNLFITNIKYLMVKNIKSPI